MAGKIKSMTLSKNIVFFIAFFASMLFGGSAIVYNIGLLIQFSFAIILIISIIWNNKNQYDFYKLGNPELYLTSAIIIVIVTQILPLPPSIWRSFEGRELDLVLRTALGVETAWFPLSVAPTNTALTFFAALCLFGLGWASLSLDAKGVKLAMKLYVAMAFFTIVIGTVQVSTGGSWFDFYGSGHRANLIGLFANRNHAALFLAGAIPLYVHLTLTTKSRYMPLNLLAVAGVLILFIGLIGTTSRAGILLGSLAIILTSFLSVKQKIRPSKKAVIALCIILAASIAVLASGRTSALVARFATVNEDLRWGIWVQSAKVAGHYWPFGTGFGTFRFAFDKHEPLQAVSPQFVNNAHNDYIEIVLESGLAGGLLIIAFILLLLYRTIAYCKSQDLLSIENPKLACLIFPWLCLLHSIVDYPLRRMAIAAPFVVLLVIFLRQSAAADKTKMANVA